MPLKMETDISGDVVILYCAGRLVFGDETAAFRERIKNILLGTKLIVVNLRNRVYRQRGLGHAGWNACVNAEPAR